MRGLQLKIEWKQVAVHLFAFEDFKHNGHGKSPETLFAHWQAKSTLQLVEELANRFNGNRAAHRLREDHDWEWHVEDVDLGSLHLAGGPSGTLRHEFAQKHGGKPTVKQFADHIRSLPAESLDTSLEEFVERDSFTGIPDVFKTIIGYQDTHNGRNIYHIADGYHRAVLYYQRGQTRIRAYLGKKSE
ncbi:MAG: hypothetical protein GC159_06900 [Phycisphaera sp.]|nr:hypothetical protein [Phycisphaera sp.]